MKTPNNAGLVSGEHGDILKDSTSFMRFAVINCWLTKRRVRSLLLGDLVFHLPKSVLLCLSAS